MSNWPLLNKARVTQGKFRSTPEDGFNGAFYLRVCDREVKCIASDGLGWQHVSVSQCDSRKPPNWDVMCAVKELFWEPEDCVVQFHPPASVYVNCHPGCLHLWRVTDGRVFPMPDPIMVGPSNSVSDPAPTAPTAPIDPATLVP